MQCDSSSASSVGASVQSEMSMVRKEIDILDEQIVCLLAKRFSLTRRVGVLKAQIGQPPVEPARQSHRRQLLQGLASAHGVDAELVTDLFARIQQDTVASHARLAQR